MNNEIDYIEYKFSIWLEKNDNRKDTHLVKEVITYKDGTRKPNLRIINDFKRPFYITKKHFQNHNDKREYEELKKVNTYYSTQSDLPNNIAAKIGMVGYRRNQYRDVLKSPYLYGSDVPSTAILSKMYENKFGNHFSPYTIAMLDIESDIDTKLITITSVLFGNNIYTVINRDFLTSFELHTNEQIIDKIKKIFKENVPKDYLEYILNIYIVDNEGDVIKKIFSITHSLKPDFLSIWNVMFDIKMIENACYKNNLDPKVIFSDPNLPIEYREYSFKEGPSKKKKADGTVMQIDVQDRWHTVKTASSFYIIDAMCAYSKIRAGASKVIGGYGIDNIAKKELGEDAGKLKFKNLVDENLSKEDWHREMSKKHPLEYIVYNMGDIIVMDQLEKKTNDLSVVLPTLSGYSHFDYFNSGPARIVDKLYHEILEDGLVLGTKPYMDDKDKILGLDGWIVTLDPALVVMEPMNIIKTNLNS